MDPEEPFVFQLRLIGSERFILEVASVSGVDPAGAVLCLDVQDLQDIQQQERRSDAGGRVLVRPPLVADVFEEAPDV